MIEFLMLGETVVGGGKPKKKSSAAERTVRAPKEIGKISTIQGTDRSRQITRYLSFDFWFGCSWVISFVLPH